MTLLMSGALPSDSPKLGPTASQFSGAMNGMYFDPPVRLAIFSSFEWRPGGIGHWAGEGVVKGQLAAENPFACTNALAQHCNGRRKAWNMTRVSLSCAGTGSHPLHSAAAAGNQITAEHAAAARCRGRRQRAGRMMHTTSGVRARDWCHLFDAAALQVWLV